MYTQEYTHILRCTHTYVLLWSKTLSWVTPQHLSEIHLLFPFFNAPSSPSHQHLPWTTVLFQSPVRWQTHLSPYISTYKAGMPKMMKAQPWWGFPGDSCKEPTCQCRRLKRSNLWVGKIPWRRAWQPTPVFLPGESHGQRSLQAAVHRVTKESDTT